MSPYCQDFQSIISPNLVAQMEQCCKNTALLAKSLLKFSDWLVIDGVYSTTIRPASLTCPTPWYGMAGQCQWSYSKRWDGTCPPGLLSRCHLLDDILVVLTDNLFQPWQRTTWLLPSIHYPIHSLLVWYWLFLTLHNIFKYSFHFRVTSILCELHQDSI